MNWEVKLLASLKRSAPMNKYWKLKLKTIGKKSAKVHLAMFTGPFLNLILAGTKTIESRFSTNRIAPFNRINTGDIIILKKSGGQIEAICEAGQVHFYSEINMKALKEIDVTYGVRIASKFEKGFWGKRKNAKYGTLIELKEISPLHNLYCEKKDRRGWVVLNN
jgi:ASC-1-like (ASCH) protein